MQRQNNKRLLKLGSDAFAVVEATFVLPIMFMVFLALLMLSFYLPQRAMLQRATQLAATAVATEMSDTWVYYDAKKLDYGRYVNHAALRSKSSGKGGVYVVFFNSLFGNNSDKAEIIMKNLDEKENIPVIANGKLTVECKLVNYIVYKEVVVTATREIPVPIDLEIIGFPSSIDLVVTSKAVVTDGDEFIRNVDLAVNFVYWASEKLGLDIDAMFKKVGEAGTAISNFFGV